MGILWLFVKTMKFIKILHFLYVLMQFIDFTLISYEFSIFLRFYQNYAAFYGFGEVSCFLMIFFDFDNFLCFLAKFWKTCIFYDLLWFLTLAAWAPSDCRVTRRVIPRNLIFKDLHRFCIIRQNKKSVVCFQNCSATFSNSHWFDMKMMRIINKMINK